LRRIIDQQYQVARKIIEENRDKVEKMAKTLLEWETMDSEQLKDIMEGREPRPPKPATTATSVPPKDTPPPSPAPTTAPAPGT
ncbi:MAG: cell division protein FtsH, partial [Proteobacteria bacterium]|nr:cell division protein FtsH [Pseudomonadota bacterium]